MKLKKRIAALLMAGAMICSTLPVNVLAVENSNQHTGGLCEHHTEHTEDCGYTEGTPGTPCNHEHTDECYTLVTECVHEHTEDCYPAEGVSDNTATPSDADTAEPTECAHECSEESGCITKELDCKHEHNGECGYAPATEGTPCGYVCEACNAEDSGTNPADPIEKPETECICKTLCTEEARNADCLVCGAEGADLTLCKGAEPETATPSNAAQLSAGDVQKLIDELPTADELAAMSLEEQQAVYTKLQTAYEAYNALTDEQKAEVTGEEIFDSLFDVFNGMVNTLETLSNVEYLDENGENRRADNVTVVDSSTTTWNSGWYVVSDNMEISSRITVNGDVKLILADGSSLTCKMGIYVPKGFSITIYAQSMAEETMGQLASKNGSGAAIGGLTDNASYGYVKEAGDIYIHGGKINAEYTGSFGAAGIGGGAKGSCGIISITGGIINAKSKGGPGIGGGYNKGSAGNITITGGTVTAQGGGNSAGIGSGYMGASGEIYIGGTADVTATGGSYGAGIGGGYTVDSGIITIEGGTVVATGGGTPSTGGTAGIGGGDGGVTKSIKITGGNVTAHGKGYAAGIGNGDNGSNTTGEIIITGGVITASVKDGVKSSSDYAQCIGLGRSAPNNYTANVTIEGDAVIYALKDDYFRPADTPVDHYIYVPKNEEPDWDGIIYTGKSMEGIKGSVYGTVDLKEDFEVPESATLTIPEGQSLYVSGVTLTNRGTITVGDNTGDGQLDYTDGVINNYGSISGSKIVPSENWNKNPAQVVLSADSDVRYGSDFTITAAVSKMTNAGQLTRSVPQKLVYFYDNGNLIGEAEVSDKNNQAEFSIKPEGEEWKPGTQHKLKARYTGGNQQLLPCESGEITVTVSKGVQTAPNAPVKSAVTTDSITLNVISGGQSGVEYGYSKEGGSSIKWQTSNIFINLAPGTAYTFYARYIGNDYYEASPNSLDAAIYTMPLAPSLGSGYTISYAEEKATPDSGFEISTKADGGWSTESVTVSPGGKLFVRKAADGAIPAGDDCENTLDERPDAPDSLQGINETFADEKDGKITGTSSDMEYRLSSDADWTLCCGDSVTGLVPGTYLVRYKATGSAFASEKTVVEIKAGEQRTYTLNVTAPAFEPVTYGYTQPEAKAITINSTGNSDSSISSVTVNREDFVIGGSGSSVTAGGSINTWTIRPATELNAGIYTATITVRYTGDAEATAQVSFTVNQAEQDAPGKAPEQESRDRSSITLKAVLDNVNGAKAEYSRDGGANWQTSPVFTGLSSGTTYSFIVRYGATADGNYKASLTSPAAEYSTQSSGGSSSGGSSSNNDSIIIDRPDKDNPTTPTTAETKTVKADSKGNIVITKSMVDDAISAAQADARKNGNTANGIAVVVPVEISKTLNGVQITLKADALDKLVSSGVKRFTIDADRMADFGFTLDTLKELNRQTSGDIVLKVKKTSVSSAEAKAAIGNRPVYDISLWEVKGEKEIKLTDMTGVKISIALPYIPAKNEQTGNLYAVYVDGNSKVQWITKSSYDADQKAVIFEATQMGVYGISCDKQIPAFTDIGGHWAKEHILFTVSRGLFSGTSETTFGPNTTLTRGMFVTALGRLAGINPDSYKTGTFIDVKADAYYAPYVNWAASKGIVSGTTSTTFAPDSNITREQMAVIMKNYADKMGYSIPKTLETVTFADNASISSWAKDAVRAMQQAGVLSGKSNNQFDPTGNATRAEAATVLHRFVEVIIDPQTANGWVQNDSGEWNYYKNGEPVKGWLSNDQKWYWLDKTTGKMFSGGWKQIDGKQYYFYADGSMAVSTKVDGYEVGADGARR